jgi:hypothetical protein
MGFLPATSPSPRARSRPTALRLPGRGRLLRARNVALDGQHAKSPWPIACLEIVAKPRYFSRTQGFPMKSARHTTKGTIGKAVGRLFWRGPLALSLALAVALSLFHDLPAFAGRSDSSPASVTVVSSIPVHVPDSQAPGHSCHCLCHMTAQAVASPAVSPVVFNEPLYLPPQDVPARSCAGLPPFRPPRV